MWTTLGSGAINLVTGRLISRDVDRGVDWGRGESEGTIGYK